MMSRFDRILFIIILAVVSFGLYQGWKLFWFMTDDALIAFRYVSNSILGYGYTWNPPPFHPVEGYTSFLWVVVLDAMWRLFGLMPPQIANTLSLLFTFGTVILTSLTILKMKLTKQLGAYRIQLIAIILIGTITNRTFLTWSSSGMETAMFNFFFMLWIVTAAMNRKRGFGWLFAMTLSAALVYLSRPDGILIIASTLVLCFSSAIHFRRSKALGISWFLSITPLLIFPAHMAWRVYKYGEWLPNTYYAKHVAAWPSAGIRYFASFCLEYSIWMWFALLAVAILAMTRKDESGHLRISSLMNRFFSNFYRTDEIKPNSTFCLTVVLLTLIGHFAYYTFIIGGDHFEWRVYSHLIPLFLISFLWLSNFLGFQPRRTILLLGTFILLSLPVPWTHWFMTKDLNTRAETTKMRVAIAGKFPLPLRWYAQAFDNLQFWLIDHLICSRHQGHKVFYEYYSSKYPERQSHILKEWGEYPVMAVRSVGVPGWVLPHVAIIDELGLNDRVISRSDIPNVTERKMAHDRVPPPGYVESFMPNVRIGGDKQIIVIKRKQKLTAEMIVAIEDYWYNRVVNGENSAGIR